MKHLVDFRVFESAGSGLTPEQEKFLNKYTKGRWSYDPATGLVDVVGDFDCRSERLKTLSGVKFGEVSWDFDCSNNQLTSLEGAPQTIEGEFGSDMVEIPKGQWGFKGWLDAYVKGNAQARKLLLTLMGPDDINQRMQEAPEQTLIDLGPIWNDPDFAEIRAQVRVPERYRDEMGLLGDLGELGF